MVELIGYPLVFSEHHPDTPVVITKEDLQITVTKTSTGFRVESNMNDSRINNNITLNVENDFLFRLVEATPEQRDLINTLSELKEYPQEAEKPLAALLLRLSRKMTVHSDLVQSENQLKKIDADPQITVLLQPMGEGIKAELFVKPLTDQPPYCKPGKGNVSIIGTINKEKVQVIRNFEEEQT